jgi:hypothetical protein
LTRSSEHVGVGLRVGELGIVRHFSLAILLIRLAMQAVSLGKQRTCFVSKLGLVEGMRREGLVFVVLGLLLCNGKIHEFVLDTNADFANVSHRSRHLFLSARIFFHW